MVTAQRGQQVLGPVRHHLSGVPPGAPLGSQGACGEGASSPGPLGQEVVPTTCPSSQQGLGLLLLQQAGVDAAWQVAE